MSLPFDLLDEDPPTPWDGPSTTGWICGACGRWNPDDCFEDCRFCGGYGPERRAEIVTNERPENLEETADDDCPF